MVMRGPRAAFIRHDYRHLPSPNPVQFASPGIVQNIIKTDVESLEDELGFNPTLHPNYRPNGCKNFKVPHVCMYDNGKELTPGTWSFQKKFTKWQRMQLKSFLKGRIPPGYGKNRSEQKESGEEGSWLNSKQSEQTQDSEGDLYKGSDQAEFQQEQALPQDPPQQEEPIEQPQEHPLEEQQEVVQEQSLEHVVYPVEHDHADQPQDPDPPPMEVDSFHELEHSHEPYSQDVIQQFQDELDLQNPDLGSQDVHFVGEIPEQNQEQPEYRDQSQEVLFQEQQEQGPLETPGYGEFSPGQKEIGEMAADQAESALAVTVTQQTDDGETPGDISDKQSSPHSVQSSADPQHRRVGVCFHFRARGRCRFGTACRYSHNLAQEDQISSTVMQPPSDSFEKPKRKLDDMDPENAPKKRKIYVDEKTLYQNCHMMTAQIADIRREICGYHHTDDSLQNISKTLEIMERKIVGAKGHIAGVLKSLEPRKEKLEAEAEQAEVVEGQDVVFSPAVKLAVETEVRRRCRAQAILHKATIESKDLEIQHHRYRIEKLIQKIRRGARSDSEVAQLEEKISSLQNECLLEAKKRKDQEDRFLEEMAERRRLEQLLEQEKSNHEANVLHQVRDLKMDLETMTARASTTESIASKQADEINRLKSMISQERESAKQKYLDLEARYQHEKMKASHVALPTILEDRDIKTRKAELADDHSEFQKCSICTDRPKDTALSCGHIFCRQCTVALPEKNCPICRKKIIRRMKVYYSM